MTVVSDNNAQAHNQPAPLPVFEVLGTKISAINLEMAVAQIADWIKARTKVYVCVAPVSTVMDCQDDPNYRQIINRADMVTPDGMPIVWLGRRSGQKQVSRTYGPDLMESVCGAGQAKGYKHFFYGGNQKTADALSQSLKKRFPQIQIVGEHVPGFLAVGEREDPQVIEKINRSGADILWVGLGSPKQDYWMSLHRHQIAVPVIIGAGAAFDFLAGTKPQAPRWMQRSGLEWVFRLCCEPRRLWKRYLVGNTRFIFLLLTQPLRKGSHAVR